MNLIIVMWLIISSCSTSLCLESAADSRSKSLENHTIVFLDQNSSNDCWKKLLTTNDSTQMKCHCQPKMFGDYIKCNPDSSSLELSYQGVWAGYLNVSGNKVFGAGNTSYARNLSSNITQKLNISTVDNLCNNLKRNNVLCGNCNAGYSPTANSEFFQCISCKDSDVAYNLVYYFFTELFPPTILFGFIMLFNLDLTSAAANGFIFFSQVFEIIFTIYRGKWYMENIGKFYSASYAIWNLNFLKSFRFLDYCIHPDMQTIHVIALEYIVALYPLFLIGILYAMVTLYNKGFRCVLWCGRPVHRCVARFRRPWKLSTTIAHTFAAFLVLSFIKFTLIYFRLLSPSYLYNQTGHVISVRLYFQGDMEFFKGVHVIYGTIAIILLLFVQLPTSPLPTEVVPSLCEISHIQEVRIDWRKAWTISKYLLWRS